MDRKFIMSAFGYAIVGMCLGIFMAASKNHGQLVTHAHVMLVGFLLSFAYALCHKLWLGNPAAGLAKVQYYIHQAGALLMAVGLFILYGQFMTPEAIEPVLSSSSLLVLVGMVLMKVMFLRSARAAAPQA